MKYKDIKSRYFLPEVIELRFSCRGWNSSYPVEAKYSPVTNAYEVSESCLAEAAEFYDCPVGELEYRGSTLSSRVSSEF